MGTKLFGLIAAGLVAACSSYSEDQLRAYKESQLNLKLAEYQSAKSAGRLLDACTRAGQIAAAYREMGSPNATAWTTARSVDCKAAMDSIYPQPAA